MSTRGVLGILGATLMLGSTALACTGPAKLQPTLPSSGTVPILWDDDGSNDGVIALVYFLLHPSYQVKAATLSPGLGHPHTFEANLARLFALLEVEGVPIAAGREQPLSGDNAFPKDWRTASDQFWGLDLPNPAQVPDERTAPQLLIQVIKDSEQPVTIFVSGPLTNVAEALRIEPSIKAGIRAIELMGGAIEVGGNVQPSGSGLLPAEWNIYIDPLAASEVFSSGIEIRLTPLDATDKVLWTESDAREWEAAKSAEGILAARLLRHTLSDWSASRVPIWDLVAALNTSNPGLCEWEALHVEVALHGAPNEGQTVVEADRPPNLRACLSPDTDAYRDLAQQVFGNLDKRLNSA